MGKTIKTRTAYKNIKVLDRSVNLASRMKNSLVQIKNKAEETQQPTHSSPVDYATDKVQNTAKDAAHEAAVQVKGTGKQVFHSGRDRVKMLRQK